MDIDKILLKVMNNQASLEEYKALEAWKSESAENIELLKQLSNQGQGEVYKEYDKETAWKKVNAMIDEPVVQSGAQGSSKVWLWCLAAVMLLGIAGYFLSTDRIESPKAYLTEDTNMSFALADQTKVWLREGGHSLKVVSDFENERVVALSGEAFFDVAHDKEKPFYIDLDNDDRVKVVGTSFNLLTQGDELDLTVYDGIVELHTLNRVLKLTKGDRATRINGSVVLVKNNDTNKLSWQNKELIFDNVVITQVFKDIESHYGVDITFQGESNNYSKCLVHTKFTEETLDNVLTELSKLYNFKYKVTGKEVAIVNLTCP